MKQFTVKDFIIHNNPCINCKQNISISIGVSEEGVDGWTYLKPLVTPSYTSIDLKITYTNKLNLVITNKTNSITSNNSNELANYLKNHKIFLRSYCDRCHTSIDSCYLHFNLNKGYIYPTRISHENVIITDNKNMYHLYSSFLSEHSVVIIDKLDKPCPPIRFELPLLPLSKFRDKEHFINKMKTYLVFS